MWSLQFLTLLLSSNEEAWNNSGARLSKVPRTFRARKAIRKTTTCLFCKAGLFVCCNGNKNKNNRKVSCLETPSFWRYKDNYVTRTTPEKFRDFRETGPRSQSTVAFSNHGSVWRGTGSYAKYALGLYVFVLVLKEDLKVQALSSAILVNYITLPVEPLSHSLSNQNPWPLHQDKLRSNPSYNYHELFCFSCDIDSFCFLF